MTESPLDPPQPPEYFRVVETTDIAHYTDVSQAPWFIQRIETAFGGPQSVNVRMDSDGTTILWFGYYYLRLGDWLWRGQVRVTDEILRYSTLRPHDEVFPPQQNPTQPPEGA